MSKFWFEDFSQLLVVNEGVIPAPGQTLARNLNSLTRLTIIACILLALINPELAASALLISIVAILAIYYGINSISENDGYKELNDKELIGFARDLFVPEKFNPVTRKRFCNDAQPIAFDEEFVSANQALVGGPNPKTLIPPIIAPPTHELEEWRTSDLTIHSAINDDRNFDMASAGYSSAFDPSYGGYVSRLPSGSISNQCSECARCPCVCDFSRGHPSRIDQILTQTIQPGVFEKSDFSEPINSLIGISFQKPFDPTRISTTKDSVTYSAFNPSRDDYLAVSDTDSCLWTPAGRGSGLLIRNGFGENGMGNGISRNFEKCGAPKFSSDGSELQTESNVFDPRFTGYGPTDRGYVEPVTGQPRYFYDDINAVTMPNFLSRNNVDVFPWASQYGSGMNGSLTENGIGFGDGYKQLAENAYSDASVKFRTEFQERLMRKRNAELWQRRVAPIHTMG